MSDKMTAKELIKAEKMYRNSAGFQDFKTRFNLARGMDRMSVLPTELIEYISEKNFGKRS